MMTFGDRVSDPVGSGWVLAFALGYFVLGAFLLAFTGATFGALHAFAAFIVLAIVAALNQLLPVLTHAPVSHPRTVLVLAASFSAGFALLIAGFYGAPTFAAAGLILAITALAWVAWNIARLILGHKEIQTRVLMACAVTAFAVATFIGGSMAGALAGRGPGASLTLAPLHASIVILGFASLLIVGVSYRFVPMFAVAHDLTYGRRLPQWVALAGVVLSTAFAFEPWGLRAGLGLLLIAGIAIARSHAKTLASRLRKRLDVSLRYGAAAWALGLLSLASALAATWQPRLWPSTIVLAVFGWICTTILGYGYKVAGFLAWQSAKERDPSAQLPALSSAVNLPLAYLALTLLALGTLAAAVLDAVQSQYAQIGYDVFAGGDLCAVAALTKLASLYLFRGGFNGIATRTAG